MLLYFQQDVDESSCFPEVLSQFNRWYDEEIGEESCLAVTHGEWDLFYMLPNQCQLDGLEVPACFKKWHNIKLVSCMFL